MNERGVDDMRRNPYFCRFNICKRDHEEKLVCKVMKIAGEGWAIV
jgi:hypothetical protein